MNAAITVQIIFSPVFRAYFHSHERKLTMEKVNPTVIDLLRQLSQETAGKMDALIFEKNRKAISAGLMVQVNDQTYTGTALNQKRVPLNAKDVVTLMYYISGG